MSAWMPARVAVVITFLALTLLVGVPALTSADDPGELLTPQEAATSIAQATPEAVAPSDPAEQPAGAGTDPSVEEVDGGFRADGTAVATALPKQADDATTLNTQSGALSLEPLGTSSRATDGEVVNGDVVVYANTHTDTDTVVRPTAGGVETFNNIRSEEAPETFSWEVDLAGDQELRETADGGVEVLDPTPADVASREPDAKSTPVQDSEDLKQLQDAGELRGDTQLPADQPQHDVTEALEQAGVQNDAPAQSEVDTALEQAPSTPNVPEPSTGPATVPQEAEDGAAIVEQRVDDGVATVEQSVEAEAVQELAAATDRAGALKADVDGQAREVIDSHAADNASPVVVATIHPTSAVDAEGKDVQTDLTVKNDGTISMTVDHQDEDVAYPVSADPWVEIENSYDVLRRLPIYRTEVRHVGWRDELRYVGHWWSSWMRLVPHYHVGNNWYVVGWNWGAVLMPNQGWSPMYMSVRVPVYAAVPVFSHWHLYTERVYVSTWDWEDDIEGDFGHYGTEGGLTVNDLATEMSRMLVVLPKKCIDPKGCFKPACELLGFDQNICSMNQRVHTPQWWKDRVRESPRTDRNYSSASAALRVTLGAAPADKRGERWGWAAHHIIAAYHRRGVWQRIMAEKCRIHPNESVNGVYLRGSNRKGGTTGYGRLSDGLQRRAYHPTLHTIGYFESVNYYLLDAIHGKDCDSGHARRQLDFINDYLRKNPS